MTEFTNGLKVRGSYYGRVFYDGVIYLDFDERIYLRSTEANVSICIDDDDLDNHTLQLFTIDDDELVVREGDILIHTLENRKYFILGVSGCVAHISSSNSDCYYCQSLTFHTLTKTGFKLVTDQPETIQIEGKTYKKSDIDSLTPIN